jgi:hypothetical protein
MAGEAKITKKVVEGAEKLLSNVPEDKLDNVAAQLGVDVDLVKSSIKAPGTKAAKEFFSTSLEKVGKTLESWQMFLDDAVGRTETRNRGFIYSDAATAPASKYAAGGGAPPPVNQAEAITTTPPTPPNYTLSPQPDDFVGPRAGPLVPAQSQALQRVQRNLPVVTGSRKDVPIISPDEVAELGAAGQTRVQAEGAARTRRMEAEAGGPAGFQASQEELSALGETGIPLDLTLPGGLKVGAGVAAGAGALGGLTVAYKNYVQRPEAQQQIPSAVAAEVEGPEQLATVVDKAVPAMEPEKAQQLQAQAKEVLTLGQQLEKALARERDAEKKEKDRLALFRLIDKIADGVATAMGSYALLQRGSPFAVDFSKGPKIDWDARYNSIQKEYQGLRDELINKYKIDMRAEERAAEMELEREKLGIQQKEKEAEKAEKAEAKRTAAADKAEAKREATFNKMQGALATALDETTPPGRLLTEKKNLVTMGSSLIGAKTTDTLLQQALDEAKANRGWSTTIKEFLGMDVKMKPEEQAKVTRRFAELLNTKLEEAPQAPQAPQAPTGLVPMRAPDGRLLQVPANRVAEMEAKGATRE